MIIWIFRLGARVSESFSKRADEQPERWIMRKSPLFMISIRVFTAEHSVFINLKLLLLLRSAKSKSRENPGWANRRTRKTLVIWYHEQLTDEEENFKLSKLRTYVDCKKTDFKWDFFLSSAQNARSPYHCSSPNKTNSHQHTRSLVSEWERRVNNTPTHTMETPNWQKED